MSRENEKEFIGILITNIYITIVIVIAVFVVVKLNKVSHEQYKNLDDYYELLIENAVLKERLENELTMKDLDDLIEMLEHYYENKNKDTLNINQIMNDLDDLMEWTIRYYEVEPDTLRDIMELTEYILWKDSKLYERILNWWQE